MSNRYLDCAPGIGNTLTCGLKDMGLSFIVSLAIIGSFVLIDCLVFYLLLKALVVKGYFGYTTYA